jgi:hypothetical protein
MVSMATFQTNKYSLSIFQLGVAAFSNPSSDCIWDDKKPGLQQWLYGDWRLRSELFKIFIISYVNWYKENHNLISEIGSL